LTAAQSAIRALPQEDCGLPARQAGPAADGRQAPIDEAEARKEAIMNEIVVATDGSPGALVAVEEGVWLAKMPGSSVVFVAVAKRPLPFLGDPYYQRALSADLQRARGAVAAATPFAEERKVRYDVEILEGDPAETVLDVARSRAADLIVVGSRGRGGVAGAVLGSVSTEIVHRADRPVLVARKGGARRRAVVA
jgi:nucleotide-binding universal stress UspA family protein